MIVSVIGLGYIGLPTSAVISSKGIKVIGVDNNKEVVSKVNKGKINILEPDVAELVQNSVQKKMLKAVLKPEKADVFIVAVPTPFKSGHKPDLKYIESAVRAVARVLEKGNTLIIESTIPVGTSDMIIEWLKEERIDLTFPVFGDNNSINDIFVAYCPERVLPGNVVSELKANNRIIGGLTDNCAKKAEEIYKAFINSDCLLTDCRTAELSKLVENSFRDVNIAFANELSLISDKLEINVWELIELANNHPRVNILQPGPGVGGHCIAVDPWFIIDSVPNESKLIRTAREVNNDKPYFVLNKINQAVENTGKNISELKIACLGLSFKPDIDDLRESPALEISQKVDLMGFAKVLLVEPNVNNLPEGLVFKSSSLVSIDKAIQVSDIVVLLVNHYSFKSIDLALLNGKQLIDTRGIWS